MTGFVLDCSITATWIFEDEATSESDKLLTKLVNEGALVPGIWHLELGNSLVQAERRKRITFSQIAARIELIGSLPVNTDHESPIRAFREIFAIAREHNLTTYDAAYLELALRYSLPLATLDKALIGAARRAGVKTLPN